LQYNLWQQIMVVGGFGRWAMMNHLLGCPRIKMIPIDALMVCVQVKERHWRVFSPMKRVDIHIWVAHQVLAEHINAMV
jgi:hypothetical protein